MHKWKNKITKGNNAFSEGCDSEALYYYQAACQRAEQLLPHWFDVEAVTAALVVSYQNLAELYFRQSLYIDALSTYRSLHLHLRNFSSINPGSDSTQSIIHRAYRRIDTELAATLKTLNLQDPNAAELMDEIKKIFENHTNQLNKDKYQ
ncbi:hypothetical protein A9Q81_26670 [Gammaproteobacteria bacterium 42_54_T18]|nr:hypothetical protein A9Q81_26670 [Gammaproteobacteria bacterium 42_54_T18]